MVPPPRMTLTVQLVLRALLAEPGREMYGYEVIRAAGLASGTVYPILARLEEAGWAESEREKINPQAEGRPPRRYYRLTAEGTVQAREAVARATTRLAALGVTDASEAPASLPLAHGLLRAPACPGATRGDPAPVSVDVGRPDPERIGR